LPDAPPTAVYDDIGLSMTGALPEAGCVGSTNSGVAVKIMLMKVAALA